MEFFPQQWHVVLLGALLAALTLEFVVRFMLPARRCGRTLRLASGRLQTIKAESASDLTDLGRVAMEAMGSTALAHCWTEFAETLHGQTSLDAQGQSAIVRYRATALAETFFTEQVLVGTPLRTEFYKHLPGILTGIGIIGTFSGLISGLSDFQVSANADEMRASLAALIQNVGHAFVVSASAILLAILVTWIEKSVLARRYREVETLCVLIDSLFDAGAGEEYLARLVQMSEEQAAQGAQAPHARVALLAELKDFLAETTRQQIAASAAQSERLADTLAERFAAALRTSLQDSLHTALQAPLARIADAVDSVSVQQGEAVQHLVGEALSGFTSQLPQLFAGQTSVEALTQRIDTLVTTMQSREEALHTRMGDLVVQLHRSVEQTQAESGERLRALLGELTQFAGQVSASVAHRDLQAQQSSIAHVEHVERLSIRLDRFLLATEAMTTSFQQQAGEQLHSSLGGIGASVTTLLNRLQEQGAQTASQHAAHQASMGEQSEALFGRLAGEVVRLTSVMGSLARTVAESSGTTQATVERLNNATGDSIGRLYESADNLDGAALGLAGSLDNMRAVIGGLADSSERIDVVSSHLIEAAQMVGLVMEEYRNNRDSFAEIVDSLQGVIANARKEASLTSEIVASLDAATSKLNAAQRSAGSYLAGVSAVLEDAHAAFADNLGRTLRVANADFHVELSEAVNRLKGAIQELGDTLDSVTLKE